MKLLLTSSGLTNDSIAKALDELTGKDPGDTRVAFIPTAANSERGDKFWLIDDLYRIKQRGYHIDTIEISALKPEVIKNILNDSDVIFVGGGDPFYVSYWLQKKGLFELLPKLLETKVYAGISAGSMIAGYSFRLSSKTLEYKGTLSETDYNNLGPIGESSSKTLGFVDFDIKPHLNSSVHPSTRNEEYVREIAKRSDKLVYAIDDQSAIKVIDDIIEVISEGSCLLLNGN